MKTKFLIIGGGISGLSFANYVDDYLIIEKEDTFGGYCRTIKRNGFIWDYAGHFFHFKTDEFKKKFLDVLNEDEIVVKNKKTKILYNNELIDFPFQTNIHQLPKEEFIDCLYDLFNKEEKDEYNNFLDMLYGKFGKSIVEKFLKPYNEKLYATDLSNLDVDAMGRFFPYADKEAIIKNMKEANNNSYNGTFLYPKNGASTFIDILYNNLDKDKVLLDEAVIEINKKEKYVITSKERKIYYEYLINTMPLNNFLPIINENDLNSKLSYNKVLVFNLGFNKKSKYTDIHWLYIPDKECNYYRVGFYDNILNQGKLSMYIEIGYSMDKEISENEIKKQLDLTLMNLKKQQIIDDDTILEEYMPIVMNPAYVHIRKETDSEIKELFEKLSRDNIYSIGRYGAWTYCSMEDCMVAAKEIAEKINNENK